jgi:hypothetical protein
MLSVVNKDRQRVLNESLSLLDQRLLNQVQGIVLFRKFHFRNRLQLTQARRQIIAESSAKLFLNGARINHIAMGQCNNE